MAFRAHNVSLQHWDKSAADLTNLEAVRELTDNMVFIGGELNATEGHIYIRDTDLGKDPVTGASAGSLSMLTFRDNGRGMTEKTWTERASRICRAADTQVDYTPDLAQTLSRFGVGINSALPPLAEDMYMIVCHGHGSARERFIVRMGKTLNQALYDECNGKADYTEQLGYALLSVPEGFVYDPKLKLSAFKQLETVIPEDDPGYNQKMNNIHEAKTLLLKASPFRTLEALLSLFDDLNGGTGVMYVRAQRQRLKGDLVPHVVDDCKDIRDQDSGATLREYLGHTYLFHKAFKPLLAARMKEQKRQQQAIDPKRPAPVLLQPSIKLFVEGTAMDPEDHTFIRALQKSGGIEKDIIVREVRGEDEQGRSVVFGWCTFTYQANTYRELLQHGEKQSSGILEGYSCCLLSREPSFLEQNAISAQSAFMHANEYWTYTKDKKGAYKCLEAMLQLDPMRPVKLPFSEVEAIDFLTLGMKPGPLTSRRQWVNYKYPVGGAGVLGIFLVNEQQLPIKVSKDGTRPKSLLPYARALMLREMMIWVTVDNPPPGYLEDQARRQEEMAARMARSEAEKARAAARKAALPPMPSIAAPPRQLPKRQSKDDANLRISGKRKATEQESIELLPSPSAPAKRRPNAAARIKSLAFQAEMVDFGTQGCDPPNELTCLAYEIWSLAKKQDQQKSASVPPPLSKEIKRSLQELKRTLQELKARLEDAHLLTSQ